MAELIALGMVKTVSIGQSAAKQLRVNHVCEVLLHYKLTFICCAVQRLDDGGWARGGPA